MTHNAAGDTVDHYTHWAWAPLCEAVLCLKLPLDLNLDQPVLEAKKGYRMVKASGIDLACTERSAVQARQ